MRTKKIFAVAAAMLVGLSFFACSEDEITTYRVDDYIYFGHRIANKSEVWDNEQTFNFAHARPGLTDTTIYYRVNTGGFVTDYDRTFHVRTVSSGTQGVNFDPIDREQTVPAGKNYGLIPVRIYYSPELEDNTFTIRMDLEPSDDFPRVMPTYQVTTNTPAVNREHFTLHYTSELTAPPLYESYMVSCIGYWSPAKFNKMNEVWGTTMVDWLDEESKLTLNIKIYLAVFANYLKARIAEGPDAAIKDPSPESTRGYMTLKGSAPLEIPSVTIPGDFPSVE
ncbi:DUF4843 domain-containing protein [Alistipes sp. OttesenSCG-928-B03]|nr:DUF4843 domain-containing protein [Alistipes sp. OttesenSCG-928-B03]